eukprot:snap_masked-scaffold651_size119386-processed-gene-0.22 protein:Tk06045 transcript:snap_masked-scaffold651_size119386-processed-gene-0.22-mRNA-1 annotation:"mono-adp-ribosyltransferase sirtuin-6"
MSCNYAEGLSPYPHKGRLGAPEKWDEPEKVRTQVRVLAGWLRESRHTVVHTGAGISTSAGIPDFRGPKGVWTLARRGLKPEQSLDWDQARPTLTHRTLAHWAERDRVQFVVSQNIDGLHMRSGLSRDRLAELHGNMFVDQCSVCQRQFVRSGAAPTVGQKVSTRACPAVKANGRACRGRLADFVLDWEAELPERDLDLALAHSTLATLSLVLGSTLQIIPAGQMPTWTQKFHPAAGKLVIINLQPTQYDRRADLVIRDYVDNVMQALALELDGTDALPEYDPTRDPVAQTRSQPDGPRVEWTQNLAEARRWTAPAEAVEREYKQKRKRPPSTPIKSLEEDVKSEALKTELPDDQV